MTKITPPHGSEYVGARPENRGVSGVVLIAGSHASVHPFPEKQHLSLDLLSCKPFDAELAATSRA